MEILTTFLQFLMFCALSFSAFLVYKNQKNLPGEKYYFLLWGSAALWWFFVMFPPSWQFFICASFFGFQLFFGFLYYLSQFELPKKYFIIGFFLILIFTGFYFYSLIGVKTEFVSFPSSVIKFMRIEFPVGISSAHLFLFISLFSFFLSLILVLKWIREKKISWNNLSRFYMLCAVLVYALITLPNAFFIYQGVYYFFFYFFIPYLVFLVYGKKEEN